MAENQTGVSIHGGIGFAEHPNEFRKDEATLVGRSEIRGGGAGWLGEGKWRRWRGERKEGEGRRIGREEEGGEEGEGKREKIEKKNWLVPVVGGNAGASAGNGAGEEE